MTFLFGYHSSWKYYNLFFSLLSKIYKLDAGLLLRDSAELRERLHELRTLFYSADSEKSTSFGAPFQLQVNAPLD